MRVVPRSMGLIPSSKKPNPVTYRNANLSAAWFHSCPLLKVPQLRPRTWISGSETESDSHLAESRKKCRMWAFRHRSPSHFEMPNINLNLNQSPIRGHHLGIVITRCRLQKSGSEFECWASRFQHVSHFGGCVFVLCFPRIVFWVAENRTVPL